MGNHDDGPSFDSKRGPYYSRAFCFWRRSDLRNSGRIHVNSGRFRHRKIRDYVTIVLEVITAISNFGDQEILLRDGFVFLTTATVPTVRISKPIISIPH